MTSGEDTLPDWHVWQVRYGERAARKGYVFHEYEQYGLPDGPIPMDYSFWVIRAQGRTILFDTGYHIPDYAEHDEVALVSPPQALRMLAIDPLEVDTVITSHFHYDHIGYIHLFRKAVVIAHRREREEWFNAWSSGDLGPHVWPRHLESLADAESEGRLRLVEGDVPLEPGLTIYTIGGHSPGQIVLRVQTPSRSLLLASDAVHFSEEIDNGWPFFAFDDLEVMVKGLTRVRKLAEETGSVVIPGHDGRTRGSYPPVPGAGGVAVALS